MFLLSFPTITENKLITNTNSSCQSSFFLLKSESLPVENLKKLKYQYQRTGEIGIPNILFICISYKNHLVPTSLFVISENKTTKKLHANSLIGKINTKKGLPWFVKYVSDKHQHP